MRQKGIKSTTDERNKVGNHTHLKLCVFALILISQAFGLNIILVDCSVCIQEPCAIKPRYLAFAWRWIF